MGMGWRGIIEEYREFLPVSKKTPVITLKEGNTPLIEADNLARHLRFEGWIYLKFEGLNPTGSFKDRGMTVAVSKALEDGSQIIICASTGNTSASAAAYGAKARIPTVVMIPEKGIAKGKLAQALIYGAKVIPIQGNFDQCLKIVKDICHRHPLTITLVNSLNDYRLEGQKTAAFEICQALGTAPDYHFIPVGNAGNIVAYWMGYRQYYFLQQEKAGTFGVMFLPPRMMGFQAADRTNTVATAIRIGSPARWQEALVSAKNSGGSIGSVTDQEILEAQKLLCRQEGIFCEPASAASIAGLIKCLTAGIIERKGVVVCTLTGNGLKDTETALKGINLPKSVKPDLNKVLKKMNI